MDIKPINKSALNSFDIDHPELKKEDRYTSATSSLPLYELKMLQEYIHNGNLQNLGRSLPLHKKNLMLLKFFKHNRNQQVEVYSKQKNVNVHMVGRVYTIGRNFVILKTLFQKIWIPYATIHATKTPFGAPNLSNSHQHINFDEESRRKVLTQFSKEVAEKEDLRQQFFDQTLAANLRYRKGTTLKVFMDSKVINGTLTNVTDSYLQIKKAGKEEKIPLQQIQLIKQSRFIPWLMNYFLFAPK